MYGCVINFYILLDKRKLLNFLTLVLRNTYVNISYFMKSPQRDIETDTFI